ncbi:MAG: hypothetical protein PT965_01520 [Clostridia bacterium]|nr:hypothetical protein [Clostridia bacterium]MDY2929557.1 hypothetical protein [Clostridiaceae bacterium]
MKKHSLFAILLSLSLLLLLSACGAKMPKDDLAWYPTDLADAPVRSFTLDREKPGVGQRVSITVQDEQGAETRVRWRKGGEQTTEPVKQTGTSGEILTMPENGVKVSDLPAIAAAADAWVWENEGHDREYAVGGMLYLAVILEEGNAENPNLGVPEATYSVSSQELKELSDPKSFDENGSFGYLLICNTENQILQGAETDFRYLIHVIP